MTGQPDLVLAAAIGALCLALAASLWAVSVRRRADQRVAAASDRLARLEGLADATQASAEAFDSAMLTVEDGHAELAWGGDSLALCARASSRRLTRPRTRRRRWRRLSTIPAVGWR